jgi:nucleoside-diphosphate-sugar epimerase
MARFLVTGGFGFIGSHLVEALLATGAHVHVVDNLSTSPIDVQAFLSLLGRPPALTYDIQSVEEYVRTAEPRFDGLFHLASVVGPVGVLRHAGRIGEMIINDTAAIARFATACSAQLVDVSTSEVYGGGRDGYCSENDTRQIQAAVTVRLEYAVAKLAAEISLVNLARTTALRVGIVRPFNVAGPRQAPDGGFVLPRFIRQALSREPLTVYGDGSMVRAFTHVSDIVNGIMLTMEHGLNGYAYNLGNPANKTTILSLAHRVVQITRSPSMLSFVDPKTLFGPLFAEANDKYPDAALAFDTLQWRPKHDIDNVIHDAVDYIASGRRA